MDQLAGTGLDEKSAKLMFAAQIKEQASFMNSVTERCFGDCVVSFRTKELNDKETSCINRCADKYFAISQVLGTKYWEEQQRFMQENS